MKILAKILLLLLVICSVAIVAIAESLNDGDIISIKYTEQYNKPELDGNNRYLYLNADGTVKLVSEVKTGTWGTFWLVKKDNSGKFRFMNMRLGEVFGVHSPEMGNQSRRWLFGNSGYVGGNENPSHPNNIWEILEVTVKDTLQVKLKNLGPDTNNTKWLNGLSKAGTVELNKYEEKWEIEKWVLKGAIKKTENDPTIWLLENNCRRNFPSVTPYFDWLAKGNPQAFQVESIVADSLPKCGEVAITIPPDGINLHQQGQIAVFRMDGGKKRWIPDVCTLNKMGGGMGKEVDDYVFNRIPEGPHYPAIPCPPPTPPPSIPANKNTNLYSVDKSKSVWIVTFHKYSIVRVHTEPDKYYPSKDIIRNPGESISLTKGQWCELKYNNQWMLMSEADFR